MRRIATKAVRTCQSTGQGCRGLSAYRPKRPLHLQGQPLVSSSRLTCRLFNTRATTDHANPVREPFKSSMSARRAAIAVLSGLVGYGAYYSYTGNTTDSSAALTKTHSLSPSSSTTKPADAISTRSLLVVGADELSIQKVVGEGPISKTTDDGQTTVEMLTGDQSSQKLRKMEQSYLVNRGRGVVRYDLVQLPSNNPIEDDHAEKIVEVPHKSATEPGGDWMFWGVFDGHSGWTTSAKLRRDLIRYVAREINETFKVGGNLPSPESVDLAMKKGFMRLDDEIVHSRVQDVFKSNSRSVAAELLAPALSGSCALLSFYDSRSNLLRVACTGDSRAVLGRRADNGKWTATPLSVDQTGGNPDEANRLRKEHPGEEHVVRGGRVLGGLEPTRAFGDAVYKWSQETAEKLRNSFFGRSQPALLKTPPYVTAEPVVTTTKIQPERGDFLVLATDGLWEMLTNEEVVGLVAKWLETQAGPATPTSHFQSVWTGIFGASSQNGLPVESGDPAPNGNGQKTPVRVRQWGISQDDDRFVVKDTNVATHLIRNALGGNNEEMVSALLTLPAPYSRRYRDDLTVQVIFFGNGKKAETPEEEIIINKDATAPAKAIKAKL